MIGLLDKPVLGVAIVLVLALIDYPLTAIARSSYRKYMSGFIEYQFSKASSHTSSWLIWIIIKILIATLVYCIWLIYSYGEFKIAGGLYLWLLGFAIGSYFIINLRHIESIMLSRLYSNCEMISGKIAYKPRFTLKISAVQYLSIFLLLSLIAAFLPNYFTLGLACAPFFLVIRNLVLS